MGHEEDARLLERPGVSTVIRKVEDRSRSEQVVKGNQLDRNNKGKLKSHGVQAPAHGHRFPSEISRSTLQGTARSSLKRTPCSSLNETRCRWTPKSHHATHCQARRTTRGLHRRELVAVVSGSTELHLDQGELSGLRQLLRRKVPVEGWISAQAVNSLEVSLLGKVVATANEGLNKA